MCRVYEDERGISLFGGVTEKKTIDTSVEIVPVLMCIGSHTARNSSASGAHFFFDTRNQLYMFEEPTFNR